MLQQLRSNILYRTLLTFVVAYGLLQGLSYIPAVKNAYQQHFIKTTDKLFKDFKGEGIVKANPNTDETEEELDVMLMLSSKTLYKEAIQNGTNVRIARSYVFSRYIGLFPLIVFLALWLAVPLKILHKLIAFVLGNVLIQLFIWFRMWLHIMYSFHDYEWTKVVQLSDAQFNMIDMLGGLFLYNVVISVLVPLLIWFSVAVIPFPRSILHQKFLHLFDRS